MRRGKKIAFGFGLSLLLLAAAVATWMALDTGHPGRSAAYEPPDLSQNSAPSVDLSHGPLQVAAGGHYLMHEDGTPFFFLGDTAWTLFYRLDRAETERYLDNRRRKGFTILLVSLMPDSVELDEPDRSGETVLIGNDPRSPNEAFFAHVDEVLELARKAGMYVALLPTWGDKVTKLIGAGPEIFLRPELARAYGAWLGARYKNQDNIVWMIGGDRSAEHTAAIWSALAEGIRSTDPRHLMTYHPWTYEPLLYYPEWGGGTSATWFHDAPWLDFNSIQSGHWAFNRENYDVIAHDYARTPAKPVLDAEPNYEDHPFQATRYQWFRDVDTRKAAYWSVFAGAFGHVYGHHAIWQFATRERATGFPQPPQHTWTEAIDRPGSFQMAHLRALMQSRPFLTRVPDQGLLDHASSHRWHKQATRDADGSYAFVYVPVPGERFAVRTERLSGNRLVAWWFDPRSGVARRIGSFAKSQELSFVTPDPGPDWVLVLDDQARGYGPPGQGSLAR